MKMLLCTVWVAAWVSCGDQPAVSGGGDTGRDSLITPAWLFRSTLISFVSKGMFDILGDPIEES